MELSKAAIIRIETGLKLEVVVIGVQCSYSFIFHLPLPRYRMRELYLSAYAGWNLFESKESPCLLDPLFQWKTLREFLIPLDTGFETEDCTLKWKLCPPHTFLLN